MKVRAKFISEGGKENRVVGYANHKRIREGEILEIPEKLFSEKWMERLDNQVDQKKQSSIPGPKQVPVPAPKITKQQEANSEEPVI